MSSEIDNSQDFFPDFAAIEKFCHVNEEDISSLYQARTGEFTAAAVHKVAVETFLLSAKLALETVIFAIQVSSQVISLPTNLLSLVGVILAPADSWVGKLSSDLWHETPGMTDIVTSAFKAVCAAFFCVASPFAVLIAPHTIQNVFQLSKMRVAPIKEEVKLEIETKPEEMELKVENEPQKEEVKIKKIVPFSELKGLSAFTKERLEEVIHIFSHRDRAKEIGLTIPSFLLYGPPGCGKTTIAESIAEELNAGFFCYKMSEIGSPYSHQSSANIQEVFEILIKGANDGASIVLFIDELDMNSINRKDDNHNNSHLNEELGVLMTCIEQAKAAGILVLAATNRMGDIDSALKSRFGQKIEISYPTSAQLEEVLNGLKEHAYVDPETDFEGIFSSASHGLSFRDLAEILNRAKMRIIESGLLTREIISEEIEKFALASVILEKGKDVDENIVPLSELKGLPESTRELFANAMNIFNHPDRAKELGLAIPSFLLYGPPGCGKTTMAQSFAAELKATFFAYKMSELGSIYIHGASLNIRAALDPLIEKAKKGGRVVIFFDELDMNTGNRESSGDVGHLKEELGTLMTCIDEARAAGVLILGATNQKGQLDAALDRRFGHKIEVSYPTTEQLEEVLNGFKGVSYVDRAADFSGIFHRFEAVNLTFSDLSEIVNRAKLRIFASGMLTREILSEEIEKFSNEKMPIKKSRLSPL